MPDQISTDQVPSVNPPQPEPVEGQVPPINPEMTPPLQPPVDIPTEPTKKPGRGLIIGLILLFLSAIGAAGYFGYNYWQMKQKPNPEVQDTQTADQTQVTQPEETDPTIDWQTYINEENIFTIKYPASWNFEIVSPTEKSIGVNENEQIYSGIIKFFGPQGNLMITYGDGFGGGPCVSFGGKLEELIVNQKPVNFCYRELENKIQSWTGGCGDCTSIISKATSLVFRAELNLTHNNSRLLLDQILSTFRFLEEDEHVYKNEKYNFKFYYPEDKFKDGKLISKFQLEEKGSEIIITEKNYSKVYKIYELDNSYGDDLLSWWKDNIKNDIGNFSVPADYNTRLNFTPFSSCIEFWSSPPSLEVSPKEEIREPGPYLGSIYFYYNFGTPFVFKLEEESTGACGGPDEYKVLTTISKLK